MNATASRRMRRLLSIRKGLWVETMIRKVAHYRVKKEHVTDVRRIVSEFVGQVEKHEPRTLYEANIGDDGVTFIHFMSFPSKEDELKHRGADYTLRFVADLYPKCEDEPQFTQLSLVRSTVR